MATETQPELRAAATDAWSAQHGGAGWQDAAYRQEHLCDKGVYPLTSLFTGDGASKQCGEASVQLVHWLPREQNRVHHLLLETPGEEGRWPLGQPVLAQGHNAQRPLVYSNQQISCVQLREAYAPGTNGPSNGLTARKRRDWVVEGNEPVNGSVSAKVEIKARVARDWFGGDCDKPIADAIILSKNPDRPDEINAIRAEFTAPDLDFTAYFWIKGMGCKMWITLNDESRVPQIRRADFYEYESRARIAGNGDKLKEKPPYLPPEANQKRMHREPEPVPWNRVKRNPDSEPNSKWHLGQILTPPNVIFQKDGPFTYNYDNSLGKGQTIFILDDGLVDILAEFGGAVEEILLKKYGNDITNENEHGTLMAAFAGGRTLGVARNARMIVVQTPFELRKQWPVERFLESLINVANRCIGTKDSTVVNMSGLQYGSANEGSLGGHGVAPQGDRVQVRDRLRHGGGQR
ncbi:hypothetical protein PG987_006134 [Apiospora arundinis]